MTKFYGTKRSQADYTRFGGLIYNSDYNTDYRGKNNAKGSPIASRIIADEKFDIQCKRNIEIFKKRKES